MNLKNEFVAHRKIHFFHFATIKKYASKGHVIDFGTAKKTIVESTIDKNHPNKIALREITTVESTAFKFLQIDFLFTISDVVVFDVKEIVWHLSILVILATKKQNLETLKEGNAIIF
jgi:hypothetical protein